MRASAAQLMVREPGLKSAAICNLSDEVSRVAQLCSSSCLVGALHKQQVFNVCKWMGSYSLVRVCVHAYASAGNSPLVQ